MKTISWSDKAQLKGVSVLCGEGGIIVSPTKVGYILITTDTTGLMRKFKAKKRNFNKPGVVLCSSMDQLCQLADLNAEVKAFYQQHWDDDILLGCILPWKENEYVKLSKDVANLASDPRKTSCFVIKFGIPSENIVKELWEKHKKLSFASSANPSGQGNRGLVSGIGNDIEQEADLIIEADKYVASIQSEKNETTRYEQGVMVSMVDEKGKLIPSQNGKRSITPAPVVIRKGLDILAIMDNLSKHYNTWDFRHGEYY